MAKVNGPFLSFGGRGQIGKSMVAAKWRGVQYVREYVKPSNPQTLAQQNVRKLFAYLREMWKLAPSEVLMGWNDFAKGRPFTGMNKFIGENVRVLKGEPNMDNFIGNPGSGGGLPPVSIAAVAGGTSGAIAVTVSAPAIPSGWVLQKAVATAFPDADPTGIFTGPYVQGTDDTTPYAITLTGLPPAALCQVQAWLVWQKSSGQLAYSVAMSVTATAKA